MKTGRSVTTETMLESSLVVADHIEVQQLNRITAIGLYPDRTLVMHQARNSPGGPVAIAKLTLLMTIKGLPVGQHMLEASITPPSGETKAAPGSSVTIPREGEAMHFVMAFGNLTVQRPGEFKVRVSTPGYFAEQSFWVQAQDLTEQLARLTGVSPPLIEDIPAIETKAIPRKKSARKTTAKK